MVETFSGKIIMPYQMIALAKEHNIQLLTNYEHRGMASNAKAYELIKRIKLYSASSFRTVPARLKLVVLSNFDWLTDPA
jgi:hypothetical protein